MGSCLAEESAGQPEDSAPSNESTAKWRVYTDQGAALVSKVRLNGAPAAYSVTARAWTKLGLPDRGTSSGPRGISSGRSPKRNRGLALQTLMWQLPTRTWQSCTDCS